MPRIRNRSKQFLFKNKVNTRYKSKGELIKESSLMMIFGFFLLLINYFIPKKIELFNSFNRNIAEILKNLLEILFYSLEVLIVLLISFLLITSLFLFLGSIIRLIKVIHPKSRKVIIR